MKKQVKELGLEKALQLLGAKKIKKEVLQKLLARIKAFCKVSYQLYLNKTEPDKSISLVKPLDAEPPNEFTNAA